MRCKISMLAILIVIGLVILGIFLVSAENTPKKISSEVYSKLQTDKEVRVFIKLKDSATKSVESDLIDIAGINKERQQFRKNLITASISAGDIERLKNDSRVESVKVVGVRQIMLQDSVPLINATVTWPLNVNGINLTGAGETVCILDTGVNYTHPDLGGCYGNNSASSPCKVVGGYDYIYNDANPMDDNGHGTHVAGIVAANGIINGVAPGAKIVMLKVCDSGGNCGDSAIINGIDWCVNNSEKFNITVISMSIGYNDCNAGHCFDDYCNDDTLAPSINDAVGKNISVAIAAGNYGSTTNISAPACVQNATPVGSIQKNDATFNYNRNWMVLLVAPGWSICSTRGTSYTGDGTCIDSSHIYLSGTSMATPHVAGAFAIANQLLKAQGKTKTPKEIERTFNSTGKRIYDSGSGLNYSRINVYAGIIALDSVNPEINLISPANNQINTTINQTFRCNASDILLKNMTFYLWNSSGVYNQTFATVNGESYNFELNITDMPVDNYKWNCLFYDENSNNAFASSNYSLFIGDYPSVNLVLPLNGTKTNQNVTFRCNASSQSQLRNVTFYLWNSTGIVNMSVRNLSGLSNSSDFGFNFTESAEYDWNCIFVNNLSLQNSALNNYSIIYDIANPLVGLSLDSATKTILSINIEANDSLSGLNGTCTSTRGNVIGTTNISEDGLSCGTSYEYNVTCYDYAGNSNTTSSSFSTSDCGGGGGGSGGGAPRQIANISAPVINLSQPEATLPEKKPEEKGAEEDAQFSPEEGAAQQAGKEGGISAKEVLIYVGGGASAIAAGWLLYKWIASSQAADIAQVINSIKKTFE